jgi:hypothetical protein
MSFRLRCAGAVLALLASAPMLAADSHRTFRVALYSRVDEMLRMKDPAWLDSRWAAITTHVKVDKVYLETYRDGKQIDQATLDQLKQYFAGKGVIVAGGITPTSGATTSVFSTFCYSDPEQRKTLKAVVEFTARNFDEILFDDFFFTTCKADGEIDAKGSRSWTAFRLGQMDEAARTLIMAPARAANPKVKVVVKYPNWYDHFQNSGFNLETEPKLFDGIYTGTETRDPSGTQHLQEYHGYSIVRYFENLKPGGNFGGWVDLGGMNLPHRFEEQLWLTLFAKAPEITLWSFSAIAGGGRGPAVPAGTAVPESRAATLAGPVFDRVDKVLPQLGRPVGVKTYKPYHSFGEDHLPSYLGMIGLPMDIVPEFPTAARTVLLTEQARFDPRIVEKIKRQLRDGKTVVITSGLLKALQGKGIEDVVELEYTGRTVSTHEFGRVGIGGPGGGPPEKTDSDIVIPEIRYFTNDSWETVTAFTSPTRTSGTPILLFGEYSKGRLYLLTIPQAQGDLYRYPQGALKAIRDVVARDVFVRLDAPARVSLFVYDNDTFIVESFANDPVQARLLTDRRITKLRDVETGEELVGRLQGNDMVFETPLTQGTFRVFAAR